jgi:hypothetical protein
MGRGGVVVRARERRNQEYRRAKKPAEH